VVLGAFALVSATELVTSHKNLSQKRPNRASFSRIVATVHTAGQRSV
jgi:hypothetical protein